MPTRYPAPWRAEERGNAFEIFDAYNQRLVVIYFRVDPKKAQADQVLTRDAARRIAKGIVRLPGLLGAKPLTEAERERYMPWKPKERSLR